MTEIWKMAAGADTGDIRTVKADNLFKILAALLNIKLPVMITKNDTSEGHKRFANYFYLELETNQLQLTSYDDITKIHLRF